MAGENLLVALVLSGLLFLQSTSGYPVFTIEPVNTTAIFTKELTFHCAATNATIYQWLMNGTNTYKLKSDIATTIYTGMENSTIISTLAIHPPHAVDKLNHTFVQCVAINHIPGSPTAHYIKSKPALVQIQGKLDAPEINEAFVNCSSRTLHVSWNRPKTLPGIPVTGYEVCTGYNTENCSSVSNTTLSWTANFSIVKASTCEVHVTTVAALSGEEKGYYDMVNNTFTQGPESIEEHQIESEVVFLADNQTFQIVFMVNLNETDACHLPNAYQVRVSYANSNHSENTHILPEELVSKDKTIKHEFSVNVAGQGTDVFSVLEPQNCIGSSTSMPVNNSLCHLQSVDLNNNYINCTFAEGSNAMGCHTVSTCRTSISGKSVTSEVTYLIELDPSLSYATGKTSSLEIGDCLTYDVSVYEVLADGSMGANATKVFSNITLGLGSLPTSNYDEMPILSPSSSTIPTENSEDTISPFSAILTSIAVMTFFMVTVEVVLISYIVWRQSIKRRKSRAYSEHIQTELKELTQYKTD